METHTTNYRNAFIAVADDCPAKQGEEPLRKGTAPTAANIQFDMLKDQPYRYTSDDVVFQVYALKNQIKEEDLAEARARFFSKGQPCLRASPLPKRYGWGIHSDAEGKIALYGCDSPEYRKFVSGEGEIKVLRAMRSSRK